MFTGGWGMPNSRRAGAANVQAAAAGGESSRRLTPPGCPGCQSRTCNNRAASWVKIRRLHRNGLTSKAKGNQ